MTTIAYRDGALAADRSTKFGPIHAHETLKIGQRESDGAMIGLAGCSSMNAAIRRWFLAGEPDPRPSFGIKEEDSSHALIIRPSGLVEVHDMCGWVDAIGPFFALGSGWEIAYGAMKHGASAEQAVRYAAECGVGSPDRIDVLRLPVNRRRGQSRRATR